MVTAIVWNRPGAVPISRASTSCIFQLVCMLFPLLCQDLDHRKCPPWLCLWVPSGGLSLENLGTYYRRKPGREEVGRIRDRDFYQDSLHKLKPPHRDAGVHPELSRRNHFHPESDPLHSFTWGHPYHQTAQEMWAFWIVYDTEGTQDLPEALGAPWIKRQLQIFLVGPFLLCISPPPTPSCSFTASRSWGLNGKGGSSVCDRY